VEDRKWWNEVAEGAVLAFVGVTLTLCFEKFVHVWKVVSCMVIRWQLTRTVQGHMQVVAVGIEVWTADAYQIGHSKIKSFFKSNN
jgi:hypothetical protein